MIPSLLTRFAKHDADFPEASSTTTSASRAACCSPELSSSPNCMHRTRCRRLCRSQVNSFACGPSKPYIATVAIGSLQLKPRLRAFHFSDRLNLLPWYSFLRESCSTRMTAYKDVSMDTSGTLLKVSFTVRHKRFA